MSSRGVTRHPRPTKRARRQLNLFISHSHTHTLSLCCCCCCSFVFSLVSYRFTWWTLVAGPPLSPFIGELIQYGRSGTLVKQRAQFTCNFSASSLAAVGFFVLRAVSRHKNSTVNPFFFCFVFLGRLLGYLVVVAGWLALGVVGLLMVSYLTCHFVPFRHLRGLIFRVVFVVAAVVSVAGGPTCRSNFKSSQRWSRHFVLSLSLSLSKDLQLDDRHGLLLGFTGFF